MSAMGEIPDRDQIAADETRIGALLRAAEVSAPAGLTRAIVARNAPRRSRRVPAFALTFATACAVAAVALLLAGGASAPSVVRAAQVALAAPAGGAPATLTATGTSIRFPNWSALGWPATGVRQRQHRRTVADNRVLPLLRGRHARLHDLLRGAAGVGGRQRPHGGLG